MTTEDIKRNAPEGATHYKDYNGVTICYYKITPTHSFFWNFNYWAVSYRDLEAFSEPL